MSVHALTSDQVTLDSFGQDPLWLVGLKVVVVFVLLLLLTLFTTWFERRVVARMQQRVVPTAQDHSVFCCHWLMASSWLSKRASHRQMPTRSSIFLRR